MEGMGHTEHQGRRTTDDYGNPIQQSGDYGSTGTGTGYGTTGTHGTTPLSGGYGHDQVQQHHDGDGVTGKLHRSGSSSSSSSSSDDDGMGGRRKKKGIKEKIMEKLPGGNKDEQMTLTTTQGTFGYEGEHGQGQEKKGVMDKIKDMLPGGNLD